MGDIAEKLRSSFEQLGAGTSVRRLSSSICVSCNAASSAARENDVGNTTGSFSTNFDTSVCQM